MGAALAVGEGGWLLIDECKQLKWQGGTETLEPRSRPPCPEAQEWRKGLWESLAKLSEPGTNLPRDSLSLGTWSLRSKEAFREKLKTEKGERRQAASGR